jgi:hypothetical protein
MKRIEHSCKTLVVGLALAALSGAHPAAASGADGDESYSRLVRSWKLEHRALVQRLTQDWLRGTVSGTGAMGRLAHLETGLATEADVRLYLGAEAATPAAERDPVAVLVQARLAECGAAVDTADFFHGRRFAVLTELPPEPEAEPARPQARLPVYRAGRPKWNIKHR